MIYLAHKNQENAREQLLLDHLRGVSERAGEFAAAFGEETVGRMTGLYHDIGKYSAEFQKYLQQGGGKRVDHSTAGAVELMARKCSMSIPMAFCVAGHHSGLMDGGNKRVDTEESKTFWGRIKRGQGKHIPKYQAYQSELEDLFEMGKSSLLAILGKNPFAGQFYTRMLFSCLVDADFLDTETFMQEGKADRGNFDNIEILKEKLDRYVEKHLLNKRGKRYGEPINQRRRKILSECIRAGELEDETSLWSLTVPTGGGKTVASLAFALHHAVRTGKKRVIYVIPYTSIIEQNAKVFRDIFGDENVIEHHCNAEYQHSDVDGDEETYDAQMKSLLATENWDAPLIVTTNVQFFESLFANRSSKCRKLHNIAESVVIFDEAQMLPIDYLRPCVAAIYELTERYRVTALLCTATQPSLDKIFQQEYHREVTEVCQNVIENYNFFRRAKIQMLDRKVSLKEMTEHLREAKQILCIVNTKKSARLLFEELQGECGVFYLSTNLCPKHRKQVLQKIRKALAMGETCRVISTSLIEAGVDVDFPCVCRELAGLDSIIQAAGRCNREGKNSRDDSLVYVFVWEDKSLGNLQHSIKICRSATEFISGTYHEDLGSPAAIQAYFEFLHKLDGNGLDKKDILKLIKNGDMPFESVTKEFTLIEMSTRMVFIPYDEAGKALEDQLREGKRSRNFLRKAGQYMVNVYCGQENSPFARMVGSYKVEELDDSIAILIDSGCYSDTMGLQQEIEDGQGIMI